MPFIEAETDADLGFALGVVHHHLRAGQMLLLTYISQGRLSEVAGPFAVQHLLGNVPVLGRFFQLGDLPSGGSRETLLKRAHGLVRERHNARFGAQARHISDMADDDANWFVLFGGQDGWLGSANFAEGGRLRGPPRARAADINPILGRL